MTCEQYIVARVQSLTRAQGEYHPGPALSYSVRGMCHEVIVITPGGSRPHAVQHMAVPAAVLVPHPRTVQPTCANHAVPDSPAQPCLHRRTPHSRQWLHPHHWRHQLLLGVLFAHGQPVPEQHDSHGQQCCLFLWPKKAMLHLHHASCCPAFVLLETTVQLTPRLTAWCCINVKRASVSDSCACCSDLQALTVVLEAAGTSASRTCRNSAVKDGSQPSGLYQSR